MDQIITRGLEMAPYMLSALPVILAFRWLRARGLQKRNLHTTWRHELALCTFLMFLVGLASQTVLPPFQMGEDGLAIAWGQSLRLNLVPFRIFTDSLASGADYFILNFLGNIGMFFPIGFFTALLWARPTLLKSAGAGFLSSLAIELCQLPLDRGTDIDDLLLNILGAALGYWLFLLFRKLWPGCVERCRVRSS